MRSIPSFALVCISVSVLAIGCGRSGSGSSQSSPPTAQPAPVAPAQPDPVAILKTHVESLKNYKRDEKTTLISTSFDVQKSDSLVSPYIGFINSVEELEITPTFKSHIESRYTLAFQESKWVLKGEQWREVVLAPVLVGTMTEMKWQPGDWKDRDDLSLARRKLGVTD